VIAIYLKGALACARTVLDSMIKAALREDCQHCSGRGPGGIVGRTVYAGAKAGMIGFSKRVARYGINVNVVCPGPTNTPLFQEIAGGNERLATS